MFYPFLVKMPLYMSFRRPKGGRISCTSTLCSRDSSLTLWMTKSFRDFTAPKFGQNPFLFFLVFSFCGGVCTNMPTRFFLFHEGVFIKIADVFFFFKSWNFFFNLCWEIYIKMRVLLELLSIKTICSQIDCNYRKFNCRKQI